MIGNTTVLHTYEKLLRIMSNWRSADIKLYCHFIPILQKLTNFSYLWKLINVKIASNCIVVITFYIYSYKYYFTEIKYVHDNISFLHCIITFINPTFYDNTIMGFLLLIFISVNRMDFMHSISIFLRR